MKRRELDEASIEQFVDAYIRNRFNASKTVRELGIKTENERQTGYAFLQRPAVRKRLQEKVAEGKMSGEEVVARVSAYVDANIEDFVNEAGMLDWRKAQGADALPFVRKVQFDKTTGRIISVEIVDPLDALDKLARIHSLYATDVNLHIGRNTAENVVAALNEMFAKKKQPKKKGK